MDTTPQRKPLFHPAAVAILLIGIAALIVGAIRVHLMGSSVSIQPVAAVGAREPGPMRIVVTLPPLMWAVKALAPPDAQINLLSPPGAGCEGIELTPTQAASIRAADLFVCAGSALDQHVRPRGEEAASARPVVLAISDVIVPALPRNAGLPSDQQLVLHYADPHLWLDPAMMEKWIEALQDPVRLAQEKVAESNRPANVICEDPVLRDLLVVVAAQRLKQSCQEIGADYRKRLAPFKGKSIVTHHDAWTHLAEHYGLHVAAVIQHTHDAEPSPADLADAARIINEKGIKAIFIEPQLNPAAAQRIAQITGAKLIVLDPLGDGDWPAMMRKNLDALVEGLSIE